MDCFANDREALNDFAKYYNNTFLSDISISVGDKIFAAHRIILAKNSDVFAQMLSEKWNGDKKELELIEEPACQQAFDAFLRFLYCNHIFLQAENALPLLILADKYNVTSLRNACIDYAINKILPDLSMKDLFHVWFSYATKTYHERLMRACIKVLAWHFEDMIMSEEWEKEWLSMDQDQLIELLKSNDLVLPNEFGLWKAIHKWLMAPSHPERNGSDISALLAAILPLIKFSFMTAEELILVERSPLVESHQELFQPQILLAYKFQALSLASRANCKEFSGSQFILRNYTDVRWDKRVTIPVSDLVYEKVTSYIYNLTTRSSTYPMTPWNWKLKMGSQLLMNSRDKVRIYLIADDIDQPRCIEYLIQIINDKQVLRSFTCKKNFSKARYSTDIEIQKELDLIELLGDNSLLVVNNELHLQITLRPID
ncbi:unnamed protein product [Thelazia callipaeda]|uniref:BTB domain-containing protein n=1 Tax=Thelazia callipaeda TaxID=103827 RepID=A0A0N5CN00_THECL|nr:unnamed protein product [Thelazia callipaeda]